MSAKKKTKGKESEAKEVLEGMNVLFQSRNADMTLEENERVASLDIVLMCSSDMRSLGLRSGGAVLLTSELNPNAILWLRCWSSPKLNSGFVTLNRAWWPNFNADMAKRFTSIRAAPSRTRLSSCANIMLQVISNSTKLTSQITTSAEFAAHLSSWLNGVKFCEGLRVGITFRASPVVLEFKSLRGIRDINSPENHHIYVADHRTLLSVVTDSTESANTTLSSDNAQSEPSTCKVVERFLFGGYKEQQQLAMTVLKKGLALDSDTNASIKSRGDSPLFTRPRGMLLHGPSGTGKSLLARSLCKAANVAVEVLSHGVLLTLYVGDVEKRLAKTFSEARRRSPCVVLIEDADILCRSRSHANSTSMHKSVVSSLLTLIDGLHAKTNVENGDNGADIFVLATSARPQDIDRAMRRPGRLDAEIELTAPSAEERTDILDCILQSMGVEVRTDDKVNFEGTGSLEESPLTQVELKDAAAAAHGMVGSDLLQVVKEAFLHRALRDLPPSRSIPNDSLDGTGTSQLVDKLTNLHIHADSKTLTSNAHKQPCITGVDIRVALTKVHPTAIREVVAEVPRVHWEDIGGMNDVKQNLREVVEWPMKHQALFKDLGVSPTRGVLLYGPPGCSKTLMAKALATESGMNFLSVRGPELLSKWLGESEKAVQTLFRRARAAAPCIIFFDEIDALAGQRGQASSGVSDRVLAQLLTELDGATTLVHSSSSDGGGAHDLLRVIVVAATNRPDVLDAALMRPGRIDRKIYVSPPDEASREKILMLQLQRMPLEKSVLSAESIKKLVSVSEGFSGAEVVAMVTEAAMLAVDAGKEELTMEELTIAASQISPQITPEMLKFYQNFRESVF